jgi:AraC family transcriptional regulator of adaptative response / DNA-3-methyladenine glycosylase II
MGGGSSPPRLDNLSWNPAPDALDAPNYRHEFRDHGAPAAHEAGRRLVCRALQLVLDEPTGNNSERVLGARLGVSPRHLRRLFRRHLGVTPHQFVRSAQARIGGRMLRETDMSVTEIALLAGFGSVRQFNRTFLQLLHYSPTDFREHWRLGD